MPNPKRRLMGKPAKPAPTAAELREKWVNDIIKTQKEADEKAMVRDAADADAKAAKKAHEAVVSRLQGLIRRGPSTQLELDLKDQPPLADSLREAQWKDKLEKTLLKDAVRLTPSHIEKFEAAGVKSVMDFENLRAGKNKDYPKGLRSIKGFGDAAITTLEEMMLDWYKANQPKAEPAKPADKSAENKDANGKKKEPAAV